MLTSIRDISISDTNSRYSRLLYGNVLFALLLIVIDNAFFDSVESVIAAKFSSSTSPELGTSLADDNVSGDNFLAGKNLRAQSFSDGISVPFSDPRCFSMSHKL